MLIVFAFIIALFFAMNIGASGSAASMGIAYGSGALRFRIVALSLCAVGIFLGSLLGSKEVIKTIGTGLIPSSLLSIELVLIILTSACATLFFANMIGIPLSTSEVTVGSVVGVGIAYQTVYFKHVLSVVVWWIIIPIVAFFFAFLVGKLTGKLIQKNTLPKVKNKRMLIFFVVLAGFFEAFSAGMNNAANAIGPLVGANFLSIEKGMLLGGLFVAIGALTLGGRVLETNGKKITRLTIHDGVVVSFTSGFLVMIASLFGIPIPMTQITTTGILGIGAAEHGRAIFQRNIIKKILIIWLVSPVLSLVISYTSVKVIIEHDMYSFFVILAVLTATVGSFGLLNISKNENYVRQRRM